MVEKSLKETKKKLLEEEKERKSAAATLEGAEKQAETQRLRLQDVKDQLAATKTQIVALKKKLEEAENAKALTEVAWDEAVKAKDAAK